MTLCLQIHQWTFKNDGLVFRDEDWNRLKKIGTFFSLLWSSYGIPTPGTLSTAEGNPDEDKIGAFGVGFYALFSITEEPFVASGDQWMGFYWKDGGDQVCGNDIPAFALGSEVSIAFRQTGHITQHK